MASLIRPSKDKDIVIGRFNPHGRCKKHPKHRQSPGVCSLCLRDKLSQLSTPSSSSSSRKITSLSSSSSSLSSYDSSSASSCASPSTLPFPLEPTKSASNSVSIFLLSAKNGGVLKSKSMSVVATRRRKTREGDDDGGGNMKSVKKSGFWSKLLHPKTKRSMEEKIKGNSTKQLVHTRSLIQTVT